MVHEYKPFDREKAMVEDIGAVERYELVVERFMTLPPEDRKKGLIYGGVVYDFSLEEV